MNPRQNFRGPSSLDSTLAENDNKVLSSAAAKNYNREHQSDNSSLKRGLSVPAVQRKLVEGKNRKLQRKEKNGETSTVSNGFQATLDKRKFTR